MEKYWFVNTVCRAYGGDEMRQVYVCDGHPFTNVSELNKNHENYETTLLSFQEISKEEYDLFKQLEDE